MERTKSCHFFIFFVNLVLENRVFKKEHQRFGHAHKIESLQIITIFYYASNHSKMYHTHFYLAND